MQGKSGLNKNRTSSERAHVARSLAGVLLGGLHSLASACMYLCWLCVHFQTARVASWHGRDSFQLSCARWLQAFPKVEDLYLCTCSSMSDQELESIFHSFSPTVDVVIMRV